VKNRNKRRLVICSTHGKIPGYVACLHVVRGGAKVAHVYHPDKNGDNLGGIMCDRCSRRLDGELDANQLVLVCQVCAIRRGINVVAPEFRTQ
jgi:hypothetical protein